MLKNTVATSAKILYIDDDPQNRYLMKRVLEADGYTVSLALDGFAGLAQAGRERPDLILLDINMPDISGYEVARNLRRMKSTRHIPILFVSANHPTREKYLQAGGNGYVSKPIDIDLILERIAAFL